ncbi:LptA/OstA family protein [Roseobacter ponti]|uniref:Lipopolysaccharide transport periplasmic protein LptA n=1 Tax=Roseobacter ponti TaxID=1891787 RepID=A0A858SLK0_9RHOB|nr:lipopolysaccharide transport periplasmic protein LptA [Roseobacter ponti]
MKLFRVFGFPALAAVFATSLWAQGAQVAFGSLQSSSDLPVEVAAENLSVDQSTGTAVFTDNVVISQGEMRLSAARVLVVYREDTSGIARLEASGGVTLVSGADAAESEKADYDIDNGTIVMTGNVLLVQGPSTLSSDRMTVELNAGTARMEGKVRTVLQTGER